MYALGYIKSKKDIRDYKIRRYVSKKDIPESHFILRNFEVLNQGNVSSCVPHALASSIGSYLGIKLSTQYIYGRRFNDNLSEGMAIPNGLSLGVKYGYLTSNMLDVNVEMEEGYYIVESQKDFYDRFASKNKIGSYARLNNEYEIKNALLRDLPVIIGVNVYENYLKVTNNIIDLPKGKIIGGHAMFIKGYNKDGWIVQNSWSESWGSKGTAILPYDYKIDESYTFSLLKEDIKKPSLYIIRSFIHFIFKILKKILHL